MTMWLAIGLVGLGSYVFRVLPLLLGEYLQPSERVNAVLQHGAVGAMSALLVLGVQGAVAGPLSLDTFAVVAALAVSGVVAVVGRPMPLVVLCGGMTYALTLAIIRVLPL
jgi:branched-subunit amino acid transport protein